MLLTATDPVRVRVATYQSVSGAGASRMEALRAEPAEEHDLRADWSFDGDARSWLKNRTPLDASRCESGAVKCKKM